MGEQIEHYLKISEFATLANISTQALRLYERKKLLLPVTTLSNNSYRYYSTAQLYIVKEIKLLQQLGLSLSEIKNCISGELSFDYELDKLKELNEKIQQRLKVGELQKKYNMKFPVDLAKHPKGYYFKKNVSVKHYSALIAEFAIFEKEIFQKSLTLDTPCEWGVEYPYNFFKETDLNVTLFSRVKKSKNDKAIFMPETNILSCISLGGYDNLKYAYEFLKECAVIYGLEKVGNFSEVYIISPMQTTDNLKFLTELRMQVK